MLVLSRKLNQTIIIDRNIRITAVGLRGNQVRLGIDAPASVGILREELCARASASEAARGSNRLRCQPAGRRTIVGSAR